MRNDLYTIIRDADKCVRQARFHEAVDYLSRALDCAMPDHILQPVYDQLGMCLKQIKDYEKAEFYFMKLLSMKEYEHMQAVYLNLVDMYEEMGNLIKALETYKELAYKYFDNAEICIQNYCFSLWLTQNEIVEKELEYQRLHVFEYMPKISIVTPIYNTKHEFLTQLLDSVLAQSYSNIELCLADGNSSDEGVRDIIKSYAEKSKKIKYIFLKSNQGISDNTNAAVSISEGEYIAFVDHDDVLAPNAMFEVVKAVNENNDVQMIYTDINWFGDNLDTNSVPMLKPDWSPHVLTRYNYIIHLVVVKKSILKKTGLLDRRLDGAQDLDMIWKVSEHTENIFHIPKVLYHWRYLETSASRTVTDCQEMHSYALSEHFNRMGINNSVIYDGTRHTVDIGLGTTGISVVIANWDNVAGVKRCIGHLLGSEHADLLEIIIVDDHSTDSAVLKYYDSLKGNRRIKIIYPESKNQTINIPKLLNTGASASHGEFLFFLSRESILVAKDWLSYFLGLHKYCKTGAMGMAVEYKSAFGKAAIMGGLEYIGSNTDLEGFYIRKPRVFPFGLDKNDPKGPINASALTHAGFMVGKNAYEEAGGFDELFPLTFYVMDFCAKLMDRGYYNVLDTNVRCIYNERESLYYGEALSGLKGEIRLFKNKWEEKLSKCDPFFNPNLSQENYDLYGCKYNIKFNNDI